MDYRIWKQGGELDFMNCRRACISRWLPNVIFVNDGLMALGRRVTLSGEPRSEAPKHLGDSAIYVGFRCVRPRRDANPRIRCPFDRLGAHAGRSAAFLGVMGTTFGRRRFARASDCASPPCKGGVLIGAPTTDGGGIMGANVARACVAVQHRISEGGADRRGPLSAPSTQTSPLLPPPDPSNPPPPDTSNPPFP